MFLNQTNDDIDISMKIIREDPGPTPGAASEYDWVRSFRVGPYQTEDFLKGSAFTVPSTDVIQARSGDASHLFDCFVSLRVLKELPQ